MIGEWAEANGHHVTTTRFHANEALPLPSEVDFAVVMGGPMNALDDAAYPWLARERMFLADVIRAGRPALGICLGAQLLAAALGATITPNPHREIGWWPVERSGDASLPWPEELEVFHWHGDTFSLPDGAERLCSSPACANQGFMWHGHVVGLQFHLEMRPEDLQAICEQCGHEIVDGPWIQPLERLLRLPPDHQERLRRLLHVILDGLAAQARPLS